MAKQLRVVVVTPEKAVLDESADMVVLTMFDGERGVQAGHSAFVGQLGPGSLRMTVGSNSKKFYIEGGFVQCRADTINILTGKALATESINAALIEKAQKSAQAMPETNPVEKASKDKALSRVKIMQRVAGV